MLLASVELDQKPISGLPYPEEGCVQTVEDVYVLCDGQHVVWHPQEGGKLPDQRPGTLALPQEVLKSLTPYAPVLAYLKAWQLPLLAPPVDGSLLDPDQLGDLRGPQKLLLSRCALAGFHALTVLAFRCVRCTLVYRTRLSLFAIIHQYFTLLDFILFYLTMSW